MGRDNKNEGGLGEHSILASQWEEYFSFFRATIVGSTLPLSVKMGRLRGQGCLTYNNAYANAQAARMFDDKRLQEEGGKAYGLSCVYTSNMLGEGGGGGWAISRLSRLQDNLSPPKNRPCSLSMV